MKPQSEQTPEFNGQCAFAVSVGKKNVAGSETCYTIQDGKKYVFSNTIARFLWRILPGRKKKAEENWVS